MNDRRHKRQRASNVAAHLRADNRIALYKVEDISESGVFIRTDEAMPMGLPVVVDLARPGLKKALRLTGKVVRQSSQGKVGIGVHFDVPDADTRGRLMHLLEELDAGKARPGDKEPTARVGSSASPPPQPAPEAPPLAVVAPPQGVTAQLAGASPESARLTVQVRGLLMELGNRDDALAAKDKEIAALTAEVEALRAEAKAARGGGGAPAGLDLAHARREVEAAAKHVQALQALLGRGG